MSPKQKSTIKTIYQQRSHARAFLPVTASKTVLENLHGQGLVEFKEIQDVPGCKFTARLTARGADAARDLIQ